MFVRNNIAFDPRIDMHSDELEAVRVNILLPKTKPTLIGTCYRPSDQNCFYRVPEEVCSNSSGYLKSEVFLTGDFNTNVGSIGNSTLVNSIINKDPTRVCNTSQSTIDLVLVSDVQKITQSGVIACGMSDHMVTYCTRKVCKQQVNCHNSVNIRSVKYYTKELFCERFSVVNWDPIISYNDVDQT